MARCLVIDYGLGNLASVTHALEHCGAEVAVRNEPGQMDVYSHLVLPGVGAFAEGMRNLHERGWVDAIREAVYDRQVRLLGVCLGMQLLADRGEEGGDTEGLGLIEGSVERLTPDTPETRVPHVGWNEVHVAREHALMDSALDGSDFYFVHSYHLVPGNREQVVATTPYCGQFAAVVAAGTVIGFQFHPEKSQKLGLRLLSRVLAN
ncbi:MAG: imidazole glycerol phosphate synthase subunit HisH [Gemmatimonadetes bacterium]|nr:imidazole glycerol phosphate synthase subunit HisH [Gemmatimonadota bacterium]